MIDDYKLFARTAALGSLSAAARELRISVAMVSKRLVRLEQRLGVRLINRSTRRLALTDVGTQFFHKVTAILEACEDAENMVAGRVDHPSGRLRISAGVVVARELVSRHLASFLHRFPDVRIEIELNDQFVDLRRDEFDLGIRVIDSDAIEPHLTGHLLAFNPRALYCSKEYIERRGEPRTLAELRTHDLLGATSQFPWHLEGPEGVAVVHGESLVRTNASEVIRDVLVGGLGIALRSPLDVAEALDSGLLVRILPEYRGGSNLGVFAVHLRDSFVPAAAKAFIQHLQPFFRASRLPPERGGPDA